MVPADVKREKRHLAYHHQKQGQGPLYPHPRLCQLQAVSLVVCVLLFQSKYQ